MSQVIIRPDSAGDETNIAVQYPDSGSHWDKVDEVSPDEDATYVYNFDDYLRDLYNLGAPGVTGTINWVQVWVRCRYESAQGYAKTAIKTNGVAYDGSEVAVGSSYADYGTQYNTNPQTGSAWTWTQINALQAGVSLKGAGKGAGAHCTQVYVIIDYTAAVAYEKTLTESLGLVDKVVKTPSVVKTEALGLVDTYARTWAIYRTYSELLGLADAVAKMPSKTFPEALGLVDVLTKEPGKVLAESLGLVDAYSRIWAAYRTYSELLGLADSVQKDMTLHPLTETLGLVDSVVKSPSITRSELLGLKDFMVKDISLIRSEILGLLDSSAKAIAKTFPEPLGLVDGVVKDITITRSESLGLEDRVSKHVSLHALTEVLGLLDSVSYTPNPIDLAKLIRKLIQLVNIGGGVES
jgi:hypothetical protein